MTSPKIIAFVFLFYSCISFDKIPANNENSLFIQIEQKMLSSFQNHKFFINDNLIEVYEEKINSDPTISYKRRLKRKFSIDQLSTLEEKANKTFNLEQDSFLSSALGGVVFIISIRFEDQTKDIFILNSVPIEIQDLFLSINELIPYRKPHLSYGFFNDTSIYDKRPVIK